MGIKASVVDTVSGCACKFKGLKPSLASRTFCKGVIGHYAVVFELYKRHMEGAHNMGFYFSLMMLLLGCTRGLGFNCGSLQAKADSVV